MLNWKPWDGDAPGWDSLLVQFADQSVTQCSGWGEHKKDYGWSPIRLTASENGRTAAAAQVLTRRYPLGTVLAWVPGGPVGDVLNWGKAFRSAVRKAAGGTQLYCRINPVREFEGKEVAVLADLGWHRPGRPMLSGHSILLDVDAGAEEWLGTINAKHRYYVRKSLGSGLTWAFGNSAALRREMGALTLRLGQEKGMTFQDGTPESLESQARAMPGTVQVLIGYKGPEAVTGCVVLVQRDKAHYMAAATIESGRKLSAAYAMIATLRERLRAQHVERMDFGGIHPGHAPAQGVDHFKRGFGGREFRYLGEWDWATVSPLRLAADYLIGTRRPGAL